MSRHAQQYSCPDQQSLMTSQSSAVAPNGFWLKIQITARTRLRRKTPLSTKRVISPPVLLRSQCFLHQSTPRIFIVHLSSLRHGLSNTRDSRLNFPIGARSAPDTQPAPISQIAETRVCLFFVLHRLRHESDRHLHENMPIRSRSRFPRSSSRTSTRPQIEKPRDTGPLILHALPISARIRHHDFPRSGQIRLFS